MWIFVFAMGPPTVGDVRPLFSRRIQGEGRDHVGLGGAVLVLKDDSGVLDGQSSDLWCDMKLFGCADDLRDRGQVAMTPGREVGNVLESDERQVQPLHLLGPDEVHEALGVRPFLLAGHDQGAPRAEGHEDVVKLASKLRGLSCSMRTGPFNELVSSCHRM